MSSFPLLFYWLYLGNFSNSALERWSDKWIKLICMHTPCSEEGWLSSKMSFVRGTNRAGTRASFGGICKLVKFLYKKKKILWKVVGFGFFLAQIWKQIKLSTWGAWQLCFTQNMKTFWFQTVLVSKMNTGLKPNSG